MGNVGLYRDSQGLRQGKAGEGYTPMLNTRKGEDILKDYNNELFYDYEKDDDDFIEITD
jgi:hypothetical protein